MAKLPKGRVLVTINACMLNDLQNASIDDHFEWEIIQDIADNNSGPFIEVPEDWHVGALPPPEKYASALNELDEHIGERPPMPTTPDSAPEYLKRLFRQTRAETTDGDDYAP